jgi:dihydroflavonol-4-reductase
MMKAFVTGGTGFIGQHVVRKLRERGYEVVALVRSPLSEAARRLAGMGAEVVAGDIRRHRVDAWANGRQRRRFSHCCLVQNRRP